MKRIFLTRGFVALVSNKDYRRLSEHKWYAQPNGATIYAIREIRFNGRSTTERMHRVVLGLPIGRHPDVDHRDSDGLNNQRSNLRTCTRLQNTAHRRKQKNGTTSKYKGVSWHTQCEKWVCSLRRHGKFIYLGLFQSEEDAARAYDAAAIKHFGEFALLNFPVT